MKSSAVALIQMIKQVEAVKRGEMPLLDIVMSNGKRLGDCNGADVSAVGKAFGVIGALYDLLDV